MKNIANFADNFGRCLNWAIERVCALLMATMVVVIWFGVTERYFLELGATWTEEFSRYVMIWLALLAISCGAYRREHIGLDFLMKKIPARGRPFFRAALDCLGLAFFVFLTIFGVGMVVNGKSQYATIFGMNMVVPFLSVPVSAGLTSIQILVTMVRDLATASHETEVA